MPQATHLSHPTLIQPAADGDAGGALLAPCRCCGSQRHVHQRCLAAWISSVAERKGVHHARHCDVCRAEYSGCAQGGTSGRALQSPCHLPMTLPAMFACLPRDSPALAWTCPSSPIPSACCCRLPPEIVPREPPQQYLQRQAAALMATPAGTAASYYAAGGLVFSVACAVGGAWQRCADGAGAWVGGWLWWAALNATRDGTPIW
jgi:hypothetical protein